MHEISCTDETFDPNFTIEYILSIQVGLDGFSFCILDDIRKKFIVFKHFPFSLSNNSFLYRKVSEIVKNEEILNRNFKKVVINFVSPKFTVVPFDFKKIDELPITKINLEIEADETFASYFTPSNTEKIIFIYHQKIADFFNTKYKNPVFIHHIKPLLNLVSQKTKQGQIRALIDVSNRFYTILIYNRENLVFANSFSYVNKMDFIYFLLNTFNVIKSDTQSTRVLLTGEITEGSHIVEFIKKHFKSVEFAKLPGDFQYSYTFSKIPSHSFVSVFNFEI